MPDALEAILVTVIAELILWVIFRITGADRR